MFERDKAELRELGIPLETGRNSHFDTEDGYRIRRGDYELPPIEFDAAEAAAVGLAARLWQSATLGEPARPALIKLRAAGTEVQRAPTRRARCRTSTPATRACRPCWTPPGRAPWCASTTSSAAVEPPQRRTLEPWGVLSWRRRWYVAGFDRDRGEPRSFRLSRITGKVETVGRPDGFERPEKVDLLELVAGGGAGRRTAAHGAGRPAPARASCAASPRPRSTAC